MNRRDFLKTSVAGSAAGLAISASEGFSHMTDFEWNEATIGQLSSAMAKGRVTAAALTKQYLRRIREVDQRGPKVNSVIELNPDAVAIAEALDKERKAKGPRGPMYGIPVLIKDNIATHDKMMTTAGSLALEGSGFRPT